MKKIFHLIILIICLQVNAQDKPKVQERPTRQDRPGSVTITSFGKMEPFSETPKVITDTKNLVRKGISQEITFAKPPEVAVEMNGLVTIKIWNENKIKLETSIWMEGKNELTDENWLDKIGVSAKLFGDTMKINTKPADVIYIEGFSGRTIGYYYDRNRNPGETVYYGNGSVQGVVNGNREITLYIPWQSNLKIVNKYGLLALPDNVRNLLILNTNGEINAGNIDNLELRSSSGRFIAGVIKNGNINITHGRLYLGELSKGVLNTAYNTIEVERVGEVEFNSSSDDIDINESASISGIKNYGSLQVNVSGNLDLQGVNSRIKLRNVAPSATLIRIFDMNTDLRMPIHAPKNYSIDVKGSFVSLFSGFSSTMITDTLTADEAAEIKTKRDSLLAFAKILSGRNIAEAKVGITPGTISLKPTNVYVDGKLTLTTTKMDELKTRNDSLQERANRLTARSNTLTGGGIIGITNPVKTSDTYSIVTTEGVAKGGGVTTGTSITIRDGFSTVKNFRYRFKTNDAANPTKFDITCSNCTVDFK